MYSMTITPYQVWNRRINFCAKNSGNGNPSPQKAIPLERLSCKSTPEQDMRGWSSLLTKLAKISGGLILPQDIKIKMDEEDLSLTKNAKLSKDIEMDEEDLSLTKNAKLFQDIKMVEEDLSLTKNAKLIVKDLGWDSFIWSTSYPTIFLYLSDDDRRANEGRKLSRRVGIADYQFSVLGCDKKVNIRVPEEDLTENLVYIDKHVSTRIAPFLVDMTLALDKNPEIFEEIASEIGADIEFSKDNAKQIVSDIVRNLLSIDFDQCQRAVKATYPSYYDQSRPAGNTPPIERSWA